MDQTACSISICNVGSQVINFPTNGNAAVPFYEASARLPKNRTHHIQKKFDPEIDPTPSSTDFIRENLGNPSVSRVMAGPRVGPRRGAEQLGGIGEDLIIDVRIRHFRQVILYLGILPVNHNSLGKVSEFFFTDFVGSVDLFCWFFSLFILVFSSVLKSESYLCCLELYPKARSSITTLGALWCHRSPSLSHKNQRDAQYRSQEPRMIGRCVRRATANNS